MGATILLGIKVRRLTLVALRRGRRCGGRSDPFPLARDEIGGLAKAHADGRLEEKLAFFAKPKLLIVDELGYLPFEPNAAHLFFQLVSRRYERGSNADDGGASRLPQTLTRGVARAMHPLDPLQTLPIGGASGGKRR